LGREEEVNAAIIWYGGPLQIRESRPKVTLVARMVASVANYDYIMDWEFQMDGLVRIKVYYLSVVTSHHHLFHTLLYLCSRPDSHVWCQYWKKKKLYVYYVSTSCSQIPSDPVDP
jgi:hypothetical protein